MPTICVRGINFADTKDWTHEELQDLIGSIFLRTEPANKYDFRATAVMGKVPRNKKVTTVGVNGGLKATPPPVVPPRPTGSTRDTYP